MNAIKCQVVNHNSKKIIAVCMDRYCKQNRLCCMVCISEFHNKHPNSIVEIEDLNSFIEQESNMQTK